MDETVALPIETKARELNGKLWLALNLIQNGYKVAIGRKGDINYTLDLIEPDIYFELAPNYYPEVEKRLNELKNSGTKIVVLDTEGAVHESDKRYYERRLQKNILESVDYYFAWGEAVQAIIHKYTNFPSKDTFVTGNPRFDLLHPDLRKIYKKDSEKIHSEYGPYILINTNFGPANHEREETREEMLELRGQTINQERVNHKKAILEKFLEIIPEIASSMEINVIVRPHPSENFEIYEEKVERIDNAYVCHQGDVRKWIYAAQAVVHNCSTTGVEAAMLDVPVFSYRPVVNEEYDSWLAYHISEEFHSDTELIERLQNVSSGDKHQMSSEQKQNLKRYFYNLDTRSVNNICVILENMERSEIDDFDQFRSPIKQMERAFKSLPGSSVFKEYLGTPDSQKFPGLSRSELRKKIDIFDKYIDCESITIEDISSWKDAYWIYR